LKSESGRVKSDLAEAQAQIADLEEVAPELFYKDDFSFSGSGWAQASKEDVEYDYEGGEYYIENKKYDWVFWTVNRNAGWFDDFALEIDARLVSGPKETHYGLLFRHQDNDNFYFFRVSGDGYYSVDKQLDDRWKTIQRKRQSDFIEEGNSTNHLKVVCKGSQIVVYVNGYHLATFTDDSFHGGYVAIAVATNKPNGRVAFDNIRGYSLD